MVSNQAKMKGGAILVTNTIISLIDCNFTANVALQSGGAIYGGNNMLITSAGTLFYKNKASKGLALYLIESKPALSSFTTTKFISNKFLVYTADQSSTVILNSFNINFTQCEFTDNQGGKLGNDAIFGFTSILNLIDTKFINTHIVNCATFKAQ